MNIPALLKTAELMDQEGQPVCRTMLITDTVTQVKAMEKALEAARLLCANLAAGGRGHMALVNAFHEADDEVK